MTERLKDKPRKYKVWNYTTNPKTRHQGNNGEKVTIEEKFIIVKDKTDDIDYMDYPRDWTASVSNTIYCLRDITFTDGPKGYKPCEELLKEVRQQAEEITQSEKIKKIFYKNRTHSKFESIDKYTTQKQINEIYNKTKD